MKLKSIKIQYFKILCFLLLGLFALPQSGISQRTWSLQKCIQYARQNNLDVQLGQLDVQDAQLQRTGAKQARLPNLNARANGGLQLGRTIDPTTSLFENATVGFNSLGLSSDITIYNGSKLKNNIKQAGINLAATEADMKQTEQDIALNVSVAYLNILMSEDQLENAKKQLELSLTQLEQTGKLIDAGSRPAADLFDIKAQVSQDEQVIVNRENEVALNYLTLKQLLQFEEEKDFTVERPEIVIPDDSDPDNLKVETVYKKALTQQPGILASELRMESAGVGINIAKADLKPRLSAFLDLSSNYSTRSLDFDNPDLTNVTVEEGPDQTILVNDIPVVINEFQTKGVEFPKIAYFDQISNNFGQGIGLNLSIPIYNRGQVKNNIARSEIAFKTNELLNTQIKQRLKQNIQLAVADAKASKKKYNAALKTEEALNISYQNTEKKYKLGASNTLEFTTAKNRYDQSSVDAIIAKYEYLFKLKVIDYYQGKRIQL